MLYRRLVLYAKSSVRERHGIKGVTCAVCEVRISYKETSLSKLFIFVGRPQKLRDNGRQLSIKKIHGGGQQTKRPEVARSL